MLDSDPLCYAEMVLDRTLQDWVSQIDASSQGQLERYSEQLAERFPANITEDIAREMLMYE